LIGQKSISVGSVVTRLFDHNRTVEDQLDALKNKGFTVKRNKTDGDILISGARGIKIETAVCCKPLPGDEIKGFISRGSGIKVHRVDCPNIKHENRRLIDAVWNDIDPSSIYPVDIEIVSYDRNNLLVDLMGLISSINIKIDSLSARSHYQTKTASVSCTVYLNNLNNLYTLISKIKSITGVIEVNRISH
jgi:GTP pyrophosphokinase